MDTDRRRAAVYGRSVGVMLLSDMSGMISHENEKSEDFPMANNLGSITTAGIELAQSEPWDIGAGVAGYVWHASNPKAALLLQHGYGEYAERFVRQYNQLIPHLLQMGISVYAFDMPGHGRSPGRRGLVDIRQAIECHLAARRKLREQPLPVFLFGHSLGGLVTAGSVVRDQSGLSGVILTSAALLYDVTPGLLAFVNLLAFIAPAVSAPLKAGIDGDHYRGAETDELFTQDAQIFRGKLPMLVAATTGSISYHNWERYPEWKIPVLVLHGTEDKATDPAGSQRFFDTIAAQDKLIHLVEGGYHELLNDRDRNKTLQVVLAWFEQHLAQNHS